MVRKKDQMRMKGLLSEAITVLCKASLSYRCEFSIEGLIGITIDNEEIFLVNINEIVQKPGMRNECEKDPPHKEERPSSPPRRRPSLHSTSSQRSASSSPSHRSEELRKARRKAQESGPLAKRIKTDRNSDPIVIKEEEEDSNDFSSATAMSPATPDSAAFTSPRHENTTIHDSSTDPISNIMDSVAGLKSNTGFQIQQVPGIDDSSGDKMADDYGSHLSLSADNSLPGCSTWDGSSHNVGDQGQGGNNSQEAPGPLPAKVKVEADADASSSSWPEGGSSSQGCPITEPPGVDPMHSDSGGGDDSDIFSQPSVPLPWFPMSSPHAFANLQQMMHAEMQLATAAHATPKNRGQGRFECPVCGKRYQHRFHLKSHMLLHTEGRFPCKICGKDFPHPRYLQQHKHTMHGVTKRFPCARCKRRFSSKKNFDDHQCFPYGPD